MKMKSLFLAALVLVSASGAFAGKDDPSETGLAIIPVKGTETFRVIYKGEAAGKVKINLLSSTGTLVLSETFSSVDGFILPLNFSGLTPGDYTIEVIDASGKKTEKVAYQPGRNIRSIHISKIAGTESKYLLSIANTGNERVSLKIFDKQNNLIHAESATLSGDFAQVYKVPATSTSYTFEVTDQAGNTKTIRF